MRGSRREACQFRRPAQRIGGIEPAGGPRLQNTAMRDGEPCRHFVRKGVGGCIFLHVPYATQLDGKRAQVAAILAAAWRNLPAAVRPDAKRLVAPTVPSPSETGHRA